MYERKLRENYDHRQQVESPNYHEDHREGVWESRTHNIPEEQHEEYNQSIQAEPRYQNSNCNHHEGKTDNLVLYLFLCGIVDVFMIMLTCVFKFDF